MLLPFKQALIRVSGFARSPFHQERDRTARQWRGFVLPHRVLLERVWGPQYAEDTHYLKVFVRRLRQKLSDDPEYPRYIHTEWGFGYHFVPPG